jgi:Mce-associated membrane protein
MSTSEQSDPDRTVSDEDAADIDDYEPDVTVDEAVTAEEAPLTKAPGRRWHWAVVLPLALLAVSAVACAAVYLFLFRPDQLSDDAAQQQAVAAAREGTEAVLSYSSENLDKSLADAKSHLTGEFLDHYSKFTDEVVRPAVTQKGVKTEANVARAAVSNMQPGQAQVLVFVNQVTTSKDRPSPALATSSVMVTMVKSGGRWLISEFKPI